MSDKLVLTKTQAKSGRFIRAFVYRVHRRAWLLIFGTAAVESSVIVLILFVGSLALLARIDFRVLSSALVIAWIALMIWRCLIRRHRISEYLQIVDDHFDAGGRIISVDDLVKRHIDSNPFDELALEDAEAWIQTRHRRGLPWIRISQWSTAMIVLSLFVPAWPGCARPDPPDSSISPRRVKIDVAPPDGGTSTEDTRKRGNGMPDSNHAVRGSSNPRDEFRFDRRDAGSGAGASKNRTSLGGRESNDGENGSGTTSNERSQGQSSPREVGSGHQLSGDAAGQGNTPAVQFDESSGSKEATGKPIPTLSAPGRDGQQDPATPSTQSGEVSGQTSSSHRKADSKPLVKTKHGLSAKAATEDEPQMRRQKRKTVRSRKKAVNARPTGRGKTQAGKIEAEKRPGTEYAQGSKLATTSQPIDNPGYDTVRPDELILEKLPPADRARIIQYFKNLEELRKLQQVAGTPTSQPTTQPSTESRQ